MNPLHLASILPKTRFVEIFLAMSLGLIGFLINLIELPLGLSTNLVFGNALVFAFIRVLAPRTLVLATAVSSLGTILLWHHPWAWLVSISEAIFIGYLAGKSSPVRSDAVFWLILGAPLLLLSFGLLTQMDEITVLLEVFKQSVNGLLNVVIGELIYIALIRVNPSNRFGNWPKLNVESAVITVLMAIVLVPTAVYRALDAPGRDQMLKEQIGRQLDDRLALSNAAFSHWVQSRSLMLRVHAQDEVNKTAYPRPDLLEKLSRDFQTINISVEDEPPSSSLPSNGGTTQIKYMPEVRGKASALTNGRLVAFAPKTAGQSAQYVLTVPFTAAGKAMTVEGLLRDDVLKKFTDRQTGEIEYALILYSQAQGAFPLTPQTRDMSQALEKLAAGKRIESLASPLLLSNLGNGPVDISDYRGAHMLRTVASSELPEWHLVAIAPLVPAILDARKGQLKQFVMVVCFVLVVIVVASTISRKLTLTLRRLRQLAADISLDGVVRSPMDDIVLKELNEISGTIVTTSTVVGEDRGALARYERRLNSIGQHAPVIVYGLEVVGGLKGSLIFVSGSLEKILGYDSSEAMQPGCWSHSIHPDDYQRCVDAFEFLTPEKVVNVEYRLLHKDGHFVWVYDTLSIEPNPHSDICEAIGVIMDISERKATEEQLIQADKMASLGRMISGTAHELNQPLNFIKMAVSNLRENMVRGRLEPDHFMAKLDNVLSQVERASAIILQMRIFGRTPKEAPYPIDVRAAANQVISMVAPQFELDSTQVIISEKSDPIFVKGLPMLLEQVLLNLLLNANDAIQTRYGAANAGEGMINVTVERRDHLALIIVEDNGTGISADVLRNIFDPFFTTKAPKAGTGLGLSISYGIIRDMGGVIKAKSGRNGARFTIELPMAQAELVGSRNPFAYLDGKI